MRYHPETGEHPAFTRFRTIKIVAERAVDKAYLAHPQATEESKNQLAGELNWALLRLRFGIGNPRVVLQEFNTTVKSFPNTTKNP